MLLYRVRWVCYNKDMFLVGIFQWWYGDGLIKHVRQCFVGILRTADFFSIGLLLRTWFDPFRQISAAQVNGPLPVRFQAFLDRLFSRMVGAVVRTIVMLFGLLMILLQAVLSGGLIIGWILLPCTPIIGAVLWQMGVGA